MRYSGLQKGGKNENGYKGQQKDADEKTSSLSIYLSFFRCSSHLLMRTCFPSFLLLFLLLLLFLEGIKKKRRKVEEKKNKIYDRRK